MQPCFFLRQNVVCSEKQTYASQDNFTQPLVVMVETFRKSATSIMYYKGLHYILIILCPIGYSQL